MIFNFYLYVEIRYFLKILMINFTLILICFAQSVYYTDHVIFYTFSVHLAFVTERKYTVVSPLVASIGSNSIFGNSMALSLESIRQYYMYVTPFNPTMH